MNLRLKIILTVAAIASLTASMWFGVFAVFPIILIALVLDYVIGRMRG